jgi:aconitate hydratase
MAESSNNDVFGARATISTAQGELHYYRLRELSDAGVAEVERLPFSMKVLLESALRNVNGLTVTEDDVRTTATWDAGAEQGKEVPFLPARVLMQDFTGVPALVDLAAMRDAMIRLGGDPKRINPLVPVDLVIDHSVQVDAFGSSDALRINTDYEFTRNVERYQFLHWGQKAFDGFRVVPPSNRSSGQPGISCLGCSRGPSRW